MRALRLRAVVAVSALSVVGGPPAGRSSSGGDGDAGAAAHGDGTVNRAAGAPEEPAAAPSAPAAGTGSDTGTDGVFPRTVTHVEGTTAIEARPKRIAVLSTGQLEPAHPRHRPGRRHPRRQPQPAPRLTRTPQLPLVCSAPTGAVVLVAADLVARTPVPPLEIPVGALTSLVGGPCLLRLLGRKQGR
ncbi:iron chelate uptake ABC transporter family permease subunit [Streptomyces sp. NPDC086777]|uniref:iron chelate uptake ABC transporter family permease subunit n=1 Tax=Streptomyces sp. NPDC086777 TaxID=3154866 RepID=UPI00344E5E64